MLQPTRWISLRIAAPLFLLAAALGGGCESRQERWDRMAAEVPALEGPSQLDGVYANVAADGSRQHLWEALRPAAGGPYSRADDVVELRSDGTVLRATLLGNELVKDVALLDLEPTTGRAALKGQASTAARFPFFAFAAGQADLSLDRQQRLVVVHTHGGVGLMLVLPVPLNGSARRSTFARSTASPALPPTQSAGAMHSADSPDSAKSADLADSADSAGSDLLMADRNAVVRRFKPNNAPPATPTCDPPTLDDRAPHPVTLADRARNKTARAEPFKPGKSVPTDTSDSPSRPAGLFATDAARQ